MRGALPGFLTACLANICATVTSVDIHEDFCTAASHRLDAAEISNASVLCMDATMALPEGKFDAIAVSGSVPRIDERFIAALRPGGRLFLVVGESPVMSALLITRDGDDWRQVSLFETDIPPLVSAAAASVFSF